MRRLLSKFLGVTLATSTAWSCGGTIPVDTGSPLQLDGDAETWRADAIHLAIRELRRGREPADQQAEVPEALIDNLAIALAAVASSDLPASDTVVDVYRIHPRPELQEIIVAVDTTVAWTRAWKRGQRLTGNAVVDVILDRYSLVLEDFLAPYSNFAILAATGPLNVVPVAAQFDGIEGVRFAEPNGLMGDASDVTAEVRDGGWRLEYSLGWGDCPAGCAYHRYWAFHVHADRRVTYLGSRGSPVPEAP